MLVGRLSALYELCGQGACFVDLGYDHGLLLRRALADAWDRVVGIEQHEHFATSFVSQYGCAASHLELRTSNGFAGWHCPADSVVVCAGIGEVQCQNLCFGAETAAVRRMVLCPSQQRGLLRRHAVAAGWRIVDEQLVHEQGRWYAPFAIERGIEQASEMEIVVGPRLLQRRDPQLRPYLADVLHRYRKTPRHKVGNDLRLLLGACEETLQRLA